MLNLEEALHLTDRKNQEDELSDGPGWEAMENIIQWDELEPKEGGAAGNSRKSSQWY